MAVLPDDRIVVAGTANMSTKKKTEYDFAVVRYMPNGSLDTTFDTDGKATTPIASPGVSGVAVQHDGKVIVAGENTFAYQKKEGVLVRYNSDGSLDSGFGQGGILRINLPGYDGDRVYDVAIQHDPSNPGIDKIVTLEDPYVIGVHQAIAVARYNLDGTPDTTFANGAGRTITTMAYGIFGKGMALESDGSIIVCGFNDTDSALLLRYDPTGSLDSTFGSGGVVLFDGVSQGNRVAIQANGKIVLTTSGGVILRFTQNGAIDTTFGTGGIAQAPPDSAFAPVCIQPADGKIVTAGEKLTRAKNGSITRNFIVSRYLGDPPPSGAVSPPNTFAQPTSFASRDATVLIPLALPGDHDLTQLATEVILFRPKRRGAPRP
jgi:uncharacterized delta-60 repeat protein